MHLGLYRDETAELCQWHVPEAHFLETWSDVRSFDGTVSICQPLIAPLYGGRSAHELFAALTPRPDRQRRRHRPRILAANVHRAHRRVRPAHRRKGAAFADFDRFWRRRSARRRDCRKRLASPSVCAGRRDALGGLEPRGSSTGSGGRVRDPLPSRSQRVRRPVRQQRLAAGAAEADYEDHLGERRADQPSHRAGPSRADRAATST